MEMYIQNNHFYITLTRYNLMHKQIIAVSYFLVALMVINGDCIRVFGSHYQIQTVPPV